MSYCLVNFALLGQSPNRHSVSGQKRESISCVRQCHVTSGAFKLTAINKGINKVYVEPLFKPAVKTKKQTVLTVLKLFIISCSY